MAVNISAQFRKEETEFDGLAAIYESLVEHPLETHVVVAVVERSALTINDRKGTRTPTVRLKWVEVIYDQDDADKIRSMMDGRFKERVGRIAPDDLFTSAEGGPYDEDDPLE